MSENLPPLSYVILTFVAAFAGTIALGCTPVDVRQREKQHHKSGPHDAGGSPLALPLGSNSGQRMASCVCLQTSTYNLGRLTG